MSDASAPAAPASATQPATSAPKPGEGGAAPAGPAAAVAQKSVDEILKDGLEFKAKGRNVKVTTLEQLRHYAQKGFGSDVAFEERNKYEQELQSLKGAFKDPKALRKLLADQGLNPVDLGTEWVYEQIEAEKLTPEQQKLRELETWKAEREKQDGEAKQKQAQAEEDKRVEAIKDRLSGLYLDALQTAGIPPDAAPWFVPRIAKLADQAIEADYDADPKALAEMAIQDFRQEQTAILGKLDGASLVAMLGDELVNRIRKHDLQRLRGDRQQPRPQTNPLTDPPRQPQRARSDDPWAEIERKLNGG